MKKFTILFLILVSFISIQNVLAAEKTEKAKEPLKIRWTGQQVREVRLEQILLKINAEVKSHYSIADFKLFEERDLATSHYQFWVQILEGKPIRGRSVRIWSDLARKNAIQIEAQLEPQQNLQAMRLGFTSQKLDSHSTMKIVRAYLDSHPDDKIIHNINWSDEWRDNLLTRYVKIKGRRGFHHLWIDLTTRVTVESRYQEFPQMEIPAMVYPIYEETEAHFAPTRIPVMLKNIREEVPVVNADPYLVLRDRRYFEEKLDPILGMDPVFQQQGFWSPVDLKYKARNILTSLALKPNSYKGGLLLEGKYVTVNLHPAAIKSFPGINFEPTNSAQYRPEWKVFTKDDGKESYEFIPANTLNVRPIFGPEEISNRSAQRHPEHDPVTYINDGFDEIQVYWAVDTLMTTFHSMGFKDPELSTRPFNAILFDPDISMKDNAYYVDDTINFTTYSPKAQNYARDNTTTWHELGHGIMDRLMGDFIELADTGGLSEGMADFLAQLIIHAVTEGKPYEGLERMRIINQTGFNLTNEVHDDGEAYGGTMNDFLLLAISKFGHKEGLLKVTDLTLEAMRLSRNHPGLAAQDWFNHMLFADEIKGTGRQVGELSDLLVTALKGRNYAFTDEPTAKYMLINGEDEVTAETPGSRDQPILSEIKSTEQVSYSMHVRLKNTETYKFKFPVTVRVQYEGGPIQGAIHWVGEENKHIDHILNSENDVLDFNLSASGKCEVVNRDDGSCVDYAYIQIWNNGDMSKPVAKKRFYLRIKNL